VGRGRSPPSLEVSRAVATAELSGYRVQGSCAGAGPLSGLVKTTFPITQVSCAPDNLIANESPSARVGPRRPLLFFSTRPLGGTLIPKLTKTRPAPPPTNAVEYITRQMQLGRTPFSSRGATPGLSILCDEARE